MNLLVDIGNSRLKWALADADNWRHGACLHDSDMRQALAREWSGISRPTLVVAANVGGNERARTLTDWVRDHWSLPVHFLVAVRTQLGVTNTYDEPVHLGSDRWAALIAARHIGDAAACVVDCGTAVTLDALALDGTFAGGVILPGVGIMRECLRARASGIRGVDGRDDSCFAHNTADGVSAGTLFGVAGAVARIIEEFRKSLGPTMRVIFTGGDAVRVIDRLAGSLSLPISHEPELVLKGLALVAESLS